MIDYSIPAANAMLNALQVLIDEAAPTPGYMELYTAIKPTPGVAITDQILLGVLTFTTPCGTITDGVLTLDTPIEESNGPATGDIVWGRLFNGNTDWIADFDVSTIGSGAALELNGIHAYLGGIIRINNGNFLTV